MRNILAEGERWLADKQTTFASERVDYARSDASVEVDSTIGRNEFDVTDASGALLRVTSQDFIIPADQLLLDSVLIEPKSGDTITKGDAVFEVSSPGPGVDCWQWCENERIRYRIHTKEISASS